MSLAPKVDWYSFGAGECLKLALGLTPVPLQSDAGSLVQLRYIERYASDLDCGCFAIESPYIDRDWTMKRFLPFRDEDSPRIRFGEVSADSAAGERLAGQDSDSSRMVRVPASAWLEGFDNRAPKLTFGKTVATSSITT